ncbi:MAG: hypothetical protein WCQ99_00910 [Pseudomonadota bacterium]
MEKIKPGTDDEGMFAQGPIPFSKKNNTLSIIVKGGCDLLQIQNYLLKDGLFDAEVDYVSAGGYRINNAHTEILKRCTQATLKNYGAIVDKLHFFDRSVFRTKFFSHDYDVYIYSVLDDYTRGLYRYRATDFIIPFGDFTFDLTDASTWEYHTGHSGKHKLCVEFLEWFKNNFTFLGPLDADSFKQNMAWLSGNISHDRLLIILNGPEAAYPLSPQEQRGLRHKSMNQALHDIVKDLPHVIICDVRALVRSSAGHVHNLRHYTRQGYYLIAREINEIFSRRCHVSGSAWKKQLNVLKYFLNV